MCRLKGPLQPQLLLVSGFCAANGWNVKDDTSAVHRDESQQGQRLIQRHSSSVRAVEWCFKAQSYPDNHRPLFHIFQHEVAWSQVKARNIIHQTAIAQARWCQLDLQSVLTRFWNMHRHAEIWAAIKSSSSSFFLDWTLLCTHFISVAISLCTVPALKCLSLRNWNCSGFSLSFFFM